MKDPNIIEPYVIAIKFDDTPDYIEGDRWISAAEVELGDRLELGKNKTFMERWLKPSRPGGSLNCLFTYFVCSPEFKINPTDEYLKYINIAEVQDVFDPNLASDNLSSKISSIGKVSLRNFTEKVHTLLEAEEWDYIMRSIENKT